MARELTAEAGASGANGGRTPELARLLAAGPPLTATDWTLKPQALELILGQVMAASQEVVECGSGLSTILIGRLLAERGSGRLHAIEDDPNWADVTRRRLETEGLVNRAHLIEAPLLPHPLTQPGCEWYDERALDSLPQDIDLLLVDGPAAGDRGSERIRYPALPALHGRLAPGATVILDDVDRPGEAWVLERWRSEHRVDLELRPAERIAIGYMLPQDPVLPGNDWEMKA